MKRRQNAGRTADLQIYIFKGVMNNNDTTQT